MMYTPHDLGYEIPQRNLQKPIVSQSLNAVDYKKQQYTKTAMDTYNHLELIKEYHPNFRETPMIKY